MYAVDRSIALSKWIPSPCHLQHRAGLVHADGAFLEACRQPPHGDRTRARAEASLVVLSGSLRQAELLRAELKETKNSRDVETRAQQKKMGGGVGLF